MDENEKSEPAKSVSMRLTVSPRLYDKLSYLKACGLGASENDVAVFILTLKLLKGNIDEFFDAPLPRPQLLIKREDGETNT
jgi:hypothetical protein